MNRRRFLFATGAFGLAAAGVSAWKYWPEQGWVNPCGGALPERLARHEIVQAAWDGLDAGKVWDCHVHLVGVGDSNSGSWVSPRMDSLFHPLEYAQKLFYLNAGCVHDALGDVDKSYVERMVNLTRDMRPGCKLLLLAFDRHYNSAGAIVPEKTSFYVPNDYASKIAQQHPGYFEWVASIHPYRRDAVATLQQAVVQGARAVKWLPAAMGIDPASPQCDAFYEAAAHLRFPIISHAGRELAVQGGDAQDFGNPLKLRRALDHGVRVVVAHCASFGNDRDLDRRGDVSVKSFELFSRLMDDARYQGKVFGDISAVTQFNRVDTVSQLLAREEWHGRLLNGSDYPLPGIMPLFSVDRLVGLKLLDPVVAPVLKEIREYNPLLFDFVLKRHLRTNGKHLAAKIFETRPFFETGAA